MSARSETSAVARVRQEAEESRVRHIPRTLFVGVALIAIWWAVAWLRIRPMSDYSFFPLWLGYTFAVDGIVRFRTGTSPMARHRRRVALLFVASVGLWWVFEVLNEAIDNWRYLTPRHYSPLAYGLLASVAFSTVIPAVLTTAELARSFRWDPLRRLPPLRQTRTFLISTHAAGWLMLAAVVLVPDIAFPVVWLSLIFLLDPLVTALDGNSLGRYLERRDWSTVFNLGIAALICGWFWEMWNFYSMPKWEYSIPYGEHLHLFEMPLLGYGGYIPFGVEVFVFYQLLRTLATRIPFPPPLVSNQDAANVRGESAIETPETAHL
jgi:hypothetical protein